MMSISEKNRRIKWASKGVCNAKLLQGACSEKNMKQPGIPCGELKEEGEEQKESVNVTRREE